MKLSVALATYNGEGTILEQLRSIAAQTLPVDEVVITDDGSTDRTVEVVRTFLEEHGLRHWRVEVNAHNLGYAENFRKAMDACTGDLIFLCDQDDIWVRDRAQAMAELAAAHPEVGLLSTCYQNFRTEEPPPDVPPARPDPAALHRIPLCRKTFFLRYPGCVMCVRRTFYKRVKPYWHPDWAHDTFLWSLALLEDTCYEWPYLSLLRRVHAHQTSGHVGHDRTKRIQYLSGVLADSLTLLRAADERNSPKRTRRLYRRMARTHRYRLELVRDRKWVRALQLIPLLPFYAKARSYGVELRLALQKH